MPAPPLDVYLRYQKILLTEEEKESPEIGDLAKAFLAMEARELLPPTTNTIPDLALGQSSVNESPIKGMLAYLQDYVAVFIGWLVDTWSNYIGASFFLFDSLSCNRRPPLLNELNITGLFSTQVYSIVEASGRMNRVNPLQEPAVCDFTGGFPLDIAPLGRRWQ